MTTITELLDELERVNQTYGSSLNGVPRKKDEVKKWQISKAISRAAVNIETQRMQSRIAELERENAELKGLLEE